MSLLDQVFTQDCRVDRQLDNCGNYDVYTMEMPSCSVIGCPALAVALWGCSLLSLSLTIAWTAAFYLRKLKPLVTKERLWQRRICGFFMLLAMLTAILFAVGIAGGPSSVLAMAVLCPLLPLAAWMMALGVTFLPKNDKEARVLIGL